MVESKQQINLFVKMEDEHGNLIANMDTCYFSMPSQENKKLFKELITLRMEEYAKGIYEYLLKESYGRRED